MSTYLIGDLHGHFGALERLLSVINFKRKSDRLWFTGDLVNRGPHNVEVLRWMRAHDKQVVAVMGNHDAHLIACHRGIARARGSDTIQDVLNAPDREALIDWIVRRPLLHTEDGRWLFHAGLLPDWTRRDAKQLAKQLSKVIRKTDAVHLLARRQARPMPKRWRDASSEVDQLRLAFYAFINLRKLTVDGAISNDKGPPEEGPDVPWFERFKRGSKTMHFGHWAALGLRMQDGIIAMDSGAAWGGKLTALRLDDRALFQVNAASFEK